MLKNANENRPNNFTCAYLFIAYRELEKYLKEFLRPRVEFAKFRLNQGKLLGSKRKCPFLKKFLQSDA